MKYLIASEGNEWTSPISKRFGHAAYHLIVESDPESIIENTPHDQNLQGHGVGRFVGHELAGVIAGNVGPGAFADLRGAGLTVYIVRGKNVRESLRMVASGEVAPADQPSMKRSLHEHSGKHGGHHHGDDHDHHH